MIFLITPYQHLFGRCCPVLIGRSSILISLSCLELLLLNKHLLIDAFDFGCGHRLLKLVMRSSNVLASLLDRCVRHGHVERFDELTTGLCFFLLFILFLFRVVNQADRGLLLV